MKKSFFYLCTAALPLFSGCGNSSGNHAELAGSGKKPDATVKKECFLALDGLDSAKLDLETSASGKVSGRLFIRYDKQRTNDGQVSGAYRGDTLFVDYGFKVGKNDPANYKNPLALLKKDGKLIMGVGQIVTTLGKSYFAKDKPIDFEKGRFIFSPAECR